MLQPSPPIDEVTILYIQLAVNQGVAAEWAELGNSWSLSDLAHLDGQQRAGRHTIWGQAMP